MAITKSVTVLPPLLDLNSGKLKRHAHAIIVARFVEDGIVRGESRQRQAILIGEDGWAFTPEPAGVVVDETERQKIGAVIETAVAQYGLEDAP
jgi:hypothetical protein